MAGNGSGSNSEEILLLSDSDIFTRMIEAALGNRWTVKSHRINDGELQLPGADGQIKVIILALVELAHEPLVTLHQLNVIRLVGEVPLIIISVEVQRFRTWPDDRIWYMNFPPDWRQLTAILSEIMSGCHKSGELRRTSA